MSHNRPGSKPENRVGEKGVRRADGWSGTDYCEGRSLRVFCHTRSESSPSSLSTPPTDRCGKFYVNPDTGPVGGTPFVGGARGLWTPPGMSHSVDGGPSGPGEKVSIRRKSRSPPEWGTDTIWTVKVKGTSSSRRDPYVVSRTPGGNPQTTQTWKGRRPDPSTSPLGSTNSPK